VADLHRRRGAPVKALTAAAQVLAPVREDAPRPESWHDEAWGFRDTTGELMYAEMWLANSLSRVRLMAARRPSEPGGEPEPIESGPAADAVARLAGNVAGQSALLRSFAAHLLTPGVGYLLGEARAGGGEDWGVYSANQIRLSRRAPNSDEIVYELIEGPDSYRDVRVLPPGSLPVKVYRPHPRYSWEPDSPVRGALPILRELSLLTQHVEATATSRLAGAGALFMDSNIQFEDGWDRWVDEFLESIVRPIKDRASAAAYAPFPIRIPVPKGQKLPDLVHHLMFNTPFDEHALDLRDEAINRLATAMDMPKNALTGENENHWGRWATTEEGITLHVEPNMDLICDGLTKGYMRPAMTVAEGRRSGQIVTDREVNGVRRLRVVRNEPTLDEDGSEVIIWYDTSDLKARPDRSDDTKFAFDNWEATGDDLRREAGISDARQPDPNNKETQRRIWFGLVNHPNPDLAQQALIELGIIDEKIVVQPEPAPPAVVEDEETGEVVEPDESDPDASEGEGPPDTEGDDDPAQEERPEPPSRAAGVDPAAMALVAGADVLVYRALEKAGNRLRSKLRGRLNGASEAPPAEIHKHMNVGREWGRPLDELLAGAWEYVPATAGLVGMDPTELTVTLDAYVRDLIRTRELHTTHRLACWLGFEDQVSPQPHLNVVAS
jgi:hypothetical protein